jgi:ribosomal protein S18 acetylase RimI-like enzyme
VVQDGRDLKSAMPIAIRPVEERDIAAMAAIRARERETEAFWAPRIAAYLSGEHSPQQALAARAAFVATEGDAMLGFVSGHRTRRYGCDGELQWVNVAEEARGRGIAGMLMERMAEWFVEQGALRVCVNVAPDNVPAVRLYAKHGAKPLNEHWMVWDDVRRMKRGLE